MIISQWRCPPKLVALVLATTDSQQGLHEVSGGIALAEAEGELSDNNPDSPPAPSPSRPFSRSGLCMCRCVCVYHIPFLHGNGHAPLTLV